MTSKFGILVARQRSGTGALGSVLDMHPELSYFGEVFHPNNVGQSTNFFTHLLERVREDPENALPSRNVENMTAFIEDLSKLKSGFPIIDIKYRSLHHCPSDWRGLRDQPWLLEYARQNRAPIIHLTRMNFVQSFVSGRLAEANKVWHARAADEIAIKSVVVDIRRLSNYIRTSDAEIDFVRAWLRGHQSVMEVDYSDLFDEEGNLVSGIAEQISSLFNIDSFAHRRPAFKKQAPPNLRQSIENYEMVQQALAGTPYEWMVG